jgi:Domain of unknown function (DUF4386)
MEETLHSNRKTARLAGSLFVFVCVPLATLGQSYVASRIFVPNDPAATASNLLSNEFLFRSGIVSHIVSNITFAFIVLLLYRILSPVNKHLSRLMVVPVVAQVAVIFILELFNISALMILKSEAKFAFDDAQKQELSFLLLRMHRFGIGASQFFWGSCFIPFGLLVYRSQFIPRIFGILLIISGVGYVTDSCTFILLQRTDYLIVQPFIRLTFIGFLLTMLWFLIKGVREQKVSIPNT